MMSDEYVLFLDRESPHPVVEKTSVLSLHEGGHPGDAIARTRHGGGTLMRSIEEEVLETIGCKLGYARKTRIESVAEALR